MGSLWRPTGLFGLRPNIRELKQQRRRRLRKRRLKSEFAQLQTLSRLFHLLYFVKCWQMFLEMNSKGPYQSSAKKNKVALGSRPRQNVTLGIFTLQSCNDGKELYKTSVMHGKVVVLLIKPIAFKPFSLPSASSLLKLPNFSCLLRQTTYYKIFSRLHQQGQSWTKFLGEICVCGTIFFTSIHKTSNPCDHRIHPVCYNIV